MIMSQAGFLAVQKQAGDTMTSNSNATPWTGLVDYVKAHSCTWSLQPDEGEWGIHQLDDPPHNRLLGPVFARGETTGLVVREGQVLCEWGDTDRPDMTFSVTKTYLALVAGVAFDQGLLSNLDRSVFEHLSALGDEAAEFARDTFSDNHNRLVTWRQMLQFSSEWSGDCFGVPDQIDRYRLVALQKKQSSQRKGDPRSLNKPGSYWEYNDIRINQFSLALMHLFRQPLPDVLREFIMEPLGASEEWQWHGYDNSWITVAGTRMQSVPGGGHWGGGMVISANDQRLVAEMMINNGSFQGQQLVSADWIEMMREPCKVAPWYGFFTWLNTDHAASKAASTDSYFAMGIGGQLIWHDPSLKLVVVMRWIDIAHMEAIIERVLEGLSYQGVVSA